MTSVILAKTWNAEFIFQETSTNTSETAKTCFYVHVEQQSIKKSISVVVLYSRLLFQLSGILWIDSPTPMFHVIKHQILIHAPCWDTHFSGRVCALCSGTQRWRAVPALSPRRLGGLGQTDSSRTSHPVQKRHSLTSSKPVTLHNTGIP